MNWMAGSPQISLTQPNPLAVLAETWTFGSFKVLALMSLMLCQPLTWLMPKLKNSFFTWLMPKLKNCGLWCHCPTRKGKFIVSPILPVMQSLQHSLVEFELEQVFQTQTICEEFSTEYSSLEKHKL